MAQVDQITVLMKGDDQLSRPASNAARALQDVDKHAHGADKAVAAVGETAAKQTGAVAGFASALGKIGLAGLGVQTALSGIKSVVGVFSGPVQAASDLAESMSKVDVVFGKSAPAIQEWAKTTAQSMGQSRAQALEAAGGFGNLFVSMGLAQAPAADLSKKIVTLGSDLASFNNIDPAEALEKLRAGLVGEAEPLRALGVNLNEAAVEEEALRLGLAKSKKEITDSAKIQARYSLILKQTKTAQGDFTRTATGMANAQRIIAASFADIQTQIGERLLPVIAPLVSSFAQWLPQAMDRVAPLLDRAGAAFADLASGVDTVVKMLQTRGLLETLKELGLRAVPVLLEGFRSVRDLAGRIATWLRDQIAQINWTAVWSGVRNVAAGLVASLGSVVSSVTTWLVQQWQAINWTAVWGAVKNAGSGLLASLGSVAAAVTTWLGQQWAAIDWSAVWKKVTGLGTGILTGLGDVASTVTLWASAQWAKIDWPAVWESVQGHGAALVKALAPIVEDVQTWLVAQFNAIDWPTVWRTAGTGAEMTRSFVEMVRGLDTRSSGEAVGDWMVGVFVDGIKSAFAGAGGGRAWSTFGGALLSSFRLVLEAGPVAVLEGLFLDWIVGWMRGAIRRLNAEFPGAELRAAIVAGVQKIFPIKVGPLSIGLGSVSVDVSGITGAVRGALPADVKPGTGSGTGSTPAFQHGGSFLVGGSGGPDSQMVAFRATPGERVTVQTPAQQAGGGAVNVVVNVGEVRDRGDADHLASILPEALARALETARTQQGSPYAGGLLRFA